MLLCQSAWPAMPCHARRSPFIKRALLVHPTGIRWVRTSEEGAFRLIYSRDKLQFCIQKAQRLQDFSACLHAARRHCIHERHHQTTADWLGLTFDTRAPKLDKLWEATTTAPAPAPAPAVSSYLSRPRGRIYILHNEQC
jgi:hypothetical protein